jgi:hypothetical protein
VDGKEMTVDWKKRRQIPNIQIRDSADQFYHAWEILDREPPGTGVVLPQINTAAVAIELYLKCLSSEVEHTAQKLVPGVLHDSKIVEYKPEDPLPDFFPDFSFPDIVDDVVFSVSAKPAMGHELIKLFGLISSEHRQAIETHYATRNTTDKHNFRTVLESLEGAFMVSRYSFEKNDVSKYKLNDLRSVCITLHDYVDNLKIWNLF